MLFLILLALVGVGYIVASTRKASNGVRTPPSKGVAMHSPLSPEEIISRIRALATRTKYTIDNSLAAPNVVVLQEQPNLWSWGFWYPIYLQPDANGTRVEVGIKSKLVQWGPVVERSFQKLLDVVKTEIGA